MKTYLRLIAVACAACSLPLAVQAAEPAAATAPAASSPTGTWTWSQPGRDGATYEQTLKLDHASGKLTGTLVGNGQRPDVAIGDASFKDGVIAFTVTREFNGNTIVIKYEGKLDGDSIKGSSERPGRDGGAPQKRDWVATRAK
ncbi:MAG: hypothetical protein ABIZ04_25625 [Opitutus sp.]